jgi:hypothetical protein
MPGYPRYVVAGYVEGVFWESNVAVPKQSQTVKAYVCRFCETRIIAETREQVPPHECHGDGEPTSDGR